MHWYCQLYFKIIIIHISSIKEIYYFQYRHDRMKANMQYASMSAFLAAWRMMFWVVVSRSLSKFVKCGVCDYLKLMIDKDLLETLKIRLGQHFEFQSAQRIAQGRLQESCFHVFIRGYGPRKSDP